MNSRSSLTWLEAGVGEARSALEVAFERRSRFVTNTVSIAIRALVLSAVWRAIYLDHPDTTPTYKVTVAYTVIGICLMDLVTAIGLSPLEARVRSGAVGYDILRPPSLFWQQVAAGFGTTLSRVPQFVGALVVILTSGLWVPGSADRVAVGGLAAVIGVINLSMLNYLQTLLIFWIYDLRGIRATYVLVSQLCSGAIMPLYFMPSGLAGILECLPFAGVAYLPAAVLTGQLEHSQKLLAAQLAWTPALWTAGTLMTQRALRHLVVQGG